MSQARVEFHTYYRRGGRAMNRVQRIIWNVKIRTTRRCWRARWENIKHPLTLLRRKQLQRIAQLEHMQQAKLTAQWYASLDPLGVNVVKRKIKDKKVAKRHRALTAAELTERGYIREPAGSRREVDQWVLP